MIAAVVAGLAAVSVIAVIGIVVSNRRHEQPDPAPTIATGSPSGSASPGVSGSTVPTSSPAPSPTKTSATASGSEEPSIALSKGDCIKDLPHGRTITKVTLVSCTTAHAAQVGSTFSPAGSSYPGPKEYEALIAKECPTRLNKVVRSDAPSLSWAGYYPEILEWAHGDRSIKCLLIPSNKKPLTRSVVS